MIHPLRDSSIFKKSMLWRATGPNVKRIRHLNSALTNPTYPNNNDNSILQHICTYTCTHSGLQCPIFHLSKVLRSEHEIGAIILICQEP